MKTPLILGLLLLLLTFSCKNEGPKTETPPTPKVAVKTIGILLYDGYATVLKVQCDTSILEVKNLDILAIPGDFKETYKATKAF